MRVTYNHPQTNTILFERRPATMFYSGIDLSARDSHHRLFAGLQDNLCELGDLAPLAGHQQHVRR